MLRVGTAHPCPLNRLSCRVKCGKVGRIVGECRVMRSASYKR